MLQSPWRYTSKEPSGRRTYPVTPSGRTPRVKLYCSSISYAVGVDEFAGGGAAIGGAAVGGVVGGDVSRRYLRQWMERPQLWEQKEGAEGGDCVWP